MLNDLVTRVKDWGRRFNRSFGTDVSTPKGRFLARWHTHLVDHAFVRWFWTNMAEVAPGVWRSNQPSESRIATYAEMGIKSIIFLRAPTRRSYLLFEEEACARHGITLHVRQLSARNLAAPEKVLALLDLFEVIERPMLMHCKSGADRAGLASALWLLHMEGASVKEAKRQLSLHHMHVPSSPTGVLGHMLDQYAKDRGNSGLTIREWVATEYDPKALTAEWARIRAKRKEKR